MSIHADIERLQSIRSFPSLVKYLRDELEWPIDTEDFDDLTFDYEPEELGLDAKTAAKIVSIKQLRPLDSKQPWGIFFVKFEPKSLPVVALRRILSQLVLKKRDSANKSDRQAWAAQDLLFISNYGEGETRQITFAHFSDAPDKNDLPTLKVLGWDEADSVLHLEHAHQTLKEKLRWPQDTSFVDAWRRDWSSAFTLGKNEVIATTKDLCLRMAHLATAIRKKVNAILKVESEKGVLTKLMTAFRESLIHDLKPDDFADMYAQTITYGLLSAAISRTAPGEGTALVAENLTEMVPVTNPFLRELLSTFLTVGGRKGKLDFDELGINDVVQALREANLEAVLRDFNDKNPAEDPVIHFYELFLKEYDPEKRMQRGVFYTPKPVVSYIVRSVHELLQTEFGLADGLADTTTWADMLKKEKSLTLPQIEVVDPKTHRLSKQSIDAATPFVMILDPATGTATFLVEIIDVIYRTMLAKWRAAGSNDKDIEGLWQEYVADHLLPRLHGFELMMAPYAIAHMKIGLKLFETGYRFQSHERARIYLTNSLEPAQDFSDRLAFESPALAHEAQAVNAVKRSQRFTVVLGNPPYSNFGQLNRIQFILNLLEDYKKGLDEKKLNLDDDFIKFIRLSHHILSSSGCGVLGFISNNTYMDGITHRQMRHAILCDFNRISILDLHGSSKKFELSPDGSKDENVFDIQQGVGVIVASQYKNDKPTRVLWSEIWGSRSLKYDKLSIRRTELRHTEIVASAPMFFFVPKDFSLHAEYHSFFSVPDIFPASGPGVKTERDGVSIHWTKQGIQEAVEDFRTLDEATLCKKYELWDSRDWKVSNARKDIAKNVDPALFQRILYRPFDWRFTWYSGQTRGFIGTPGARTMRQMLVPGALGLIVKRQAREREYDWFLVTNTLVIDGVFSIDSKGRETTFPLWSSGESNQTSFIGREANLSGAFLKVFERVTGVSSNSISPAGIIHYAYAIFHSSKYRTRYLEFLKIDFPRVPLPASVDLLQDLKSLGKSLVALHLFDSSSLVASTTTYAGKKGTEVEKIHFSADTVWIDKARTTGFTGVPEAVWNFHIGGYQVCEKWLKDRKGRILSKEDIAHYQKIIVAISETIRLMKEIDEVIDKHGGWPGAFITDPRVLEGVRPKA